MGKEHLKATIAIVLVEANWIGHYEKNTNIFIYK